jgi:hypothetical protein
MLHEEFPCLAIDDQGGHKRRHKITVLLLMTALHSPRAFHVTFFWLQIITMNDRNANKGACGEHRRRLNI